MVGAQDMIRAWLRQVWGTVWTSTLMVRLGLGQGMVGAQGMVVAWL